MSSALQEILEKVPSLSKEEREQLLSALTQPPALARRRTSGSAYGKFAHVRTSSEEFIRRKHEEIALEERRSRKKK